MNTSLGYAKRTLTDTSVLLSGGGDKPLSNFIGSISWDSTNKKITYTPVGGNATDLVSFGSYAFKSSLVTSDIPDLSGIYLPKLTYEYNKEIAFGSTGKLLIGKFPCYDTNVTIDIDATTYTTYHATAILATQNINTSHGGLITFNVYGDASNTVAPNLYLYYPTDSRYIEIYFSPAAWSKNLIHIRCNALSAAPTDICKNVDSIPSSANVLPTNILTSTFAPAGNYVPYETTSTRASVDGTNSYPKFYNLENNNLITGYGNYWYVINLGKYSGNNFASQIAMNYQSGITDTNMFIRTAQNDSWRPWRRLLHDNNWSNYITCSSIGAATSNHNHDERYMRLYSSTDIAPTTTYGYWSAMTTQSGITSDWWHIIHTDWSGAANWRSELALPTQGRNGVRYRSDSNGESGWAFGSWVKLLDENNYTSYCATSGHDHDGRYIRWSNATADTGAMTWGTLTSSNGYNILSHCSSSDGGDMGWCYKGGQIFYQIDGFFYQNEGKYRCLDTNNWTSYISIPTVNNASLTLQTAGTTQTTFYANDSTNRTFNVTCENIGAATSGHTHDRRYLRNYHRNDDITSTEVVNTDDYIHNVGDTGGASTTMTKPSGIDNAWGILHMHLHTGNYSMQLGFGGTTGHMYFRNAYNSSTFGSWKTLIDSENIGSQSVDYANSAGAVAWDNISGKPDSFTPSSHDHTYIKSKDNYTFTSSTLPNSFDYGVSAGFVNSNAGFGSYGSVLTVRTYSGGGGSLQLYAPYSATYGGTHLKARFGNYESSSGNSWTTLKDIAWVGDIPTKVSQLTNDSGFITSSGSCASATSAGSATNIAGGAQGSIPYLTAAGTTAFLAGGTNGYVLAYNTTSKAPYWKADSNTQYYLTLNGTTKGTANTNDLGTIYAPTSSGTGFLKGTAGANGTITWSWDNSTYNNYSLPTATASALGGVKVGTTLTSDTGYTKVHIKDGFIYYKDTNTWQAANTSQVGYVPSTSANTMLYANSSGSATWGTPDLYEVNVGGNVNTGNSLTKKVAYGGVLGFYFGGGMLGYIDDDGVNINHASSPLSATTIGSSSASSGSTIDIPYILTDLYGHITAGGTHTHTISVSGYLSTGGGELTGSLTLPKNTLAIKFNTRTGAGIKYDYGGNEALMISARAYSAASILLYAGESSTTRSLDNNSGQWSAGSSASNYMGVPSMQIKNGSVLINTAVQTGSLSGDYASALYVNGDTYLGGSVKSTGNIWAGKTSDTEERQVGVQSSAGTLYMYSQGSSTGSRGLYVGAHGNSSDKKIIGIDTNNNATFYGDVSGSATSAGSASTAGSAGSATYSTYLSSNTGGIAANTTNSLTYYNTYTTTTSSTTNGIANPTTAGSGTWYHHITMVRGDSNGFFFDLAFSLTEWSTPRIYFRNRAASNYSTWKEIITSANYTEYLTGGGSINLNHKTFSSLGSSTYYRLAYVYLSGTSNTTLSTLYYTSGLYVNNSGVYHTSDIAYKEAIRKYLLKKNVLDLENPVKKFKWKGTNDEAVGFIAQETEEWCPEAVGQDEDGYKTVNYTVALSGLCSALYDEVKTLRKEIEELKDKK